MAHNAEQKVKLLVLYELLCEYTDEDHPFTTEDIIAELAGRNIHMERKILPQDIDILNEHGYTVEKCKKGKFNAYYIVDRKFEYSELALLADEIRSSKLDTTQKQVLIQKLTNFLGMHQAFMLLDDKTKSGMPTRRNTMIFNANEIAQAIRERKHISFTYYSLNAKKERIYRHDGKPYIVNPLATIWNNNNYYLLAYGDKYDNIARYRIDKMDFVDVLDEPILEKPQFKDFSVEEYRMREFSMYGGILKKVTLQITSAMIDDVYDRFGEDVKIIDIGNDQYHITVSIEASKTFYAWVVGSQGKVQIVYPEDVKTEFNQFVDIIKSVY